MVISVKRVMDALKECYDPEIPVNIVELGLVYDVSVKQGNVHIKMTLTSPGCPMAGMIGEQVREKVLAIKGVNSAEVEFVWEPVWSPDRMSPEARQKLGI